MPKGARRRGRPWQRSGAQAEDDLVRALSGTWSVPVAEPGVEVRRVQPAQALKTYLCPGCQQEVKPGTGHLVVVPLDAPDLRRHWHNPCWAMRDRRRPGR
jgi:hypothetical protein